MNEALLKAEVFVGDASTHTPFVSRNLAVLNLHHRAMGVASWQVRVFVV